MNSVIISNGTSKWGDKNGYIDYETLWSILTLSLKVFIMLNEFKNKNEACTSPHIKRYEYV